MINAISHLCNPAALALMLTGTFLGITVGAIPGLTGAMLIALCVPLTYTLTPENAMVLLVSMYVGSISGGLISATLLRMPGTPASMMTTLDGFPLAKSGQPERALGLGISASFIGGLISWLFLIWLAGPIANWSTMLGPFEMFSLVLMALVLIATVSGESILKGLLSGMLGILATIPGPSHSTGELRWTMGWHWLDGGFKLLPVLIGLFAVGQIYHDALNVRRRYDTAEIYKGGLFLSLTDWIKHAGNLIRSSFIGTFVGILPGIGANIGSVMAYSAAKGVSKSPEKFGQGSEEGIVASESANNATIGGALIPLIAIGIPGSVIDAILLSALILHGLTPGVLLFKDNPTIVYVIMFTMLLANIAMFVIMIFSVKWISRLMALPRTYMLPVILMFCMIGSYALNNQFFDVGVMLAFGVLGVLFERVKIPLAPFVIGFVLAPLAERNLGVGLQSSAGSILPMFRSPIALVFLFVSLAIIVVTTYKHTKSK